MNYAGLISQASKTYSLPDPLLLLAVVQTESSCDYSKVGGDSESFGLMQITEPTFNDICKGKIPGVSTFEDIKGQGNVANNINCGARILAIKYQTYLSGELFNCGDKNVKYYGWEAALRGYNGYGCTGNNNYVGDVTSLYKKLSSI